jgi:hypothetical protein
MNVYQVVHDGKTISTRKTDHEYTHVVVAFSVKTGEIVSISYCAEGKVAKRDQQTLSENMRWGRPVTTLVIPTIKK